MAYSSGALIGLQRLLESRIPRGGSILDIGSQDIAASSHAEIQPLMKALHGDRASPLVEQRFRPGKTWKIADIFKDSAYRYRSVDLYPGEFIIEADLNTFAVPREHHGSFDLVANLGSTEHILDQVNVFRCIHDFAKVGGVFWHHVPFTGYYNHGLFNYHPLFFVFLARANQYEIEAGAISAPHLEYTIPASDALYGTHEWSHFRQLSGITVFQMTKTADRPFQLFTDYDQAVLGAQEQSDAWHEMMKNRYDLRIRD